MNRLAATNGDFAAICDDFEACVAALEHWKNSEDPEARWIVDEYREILRDLFCEIKRHLTESEV